MELVPLYVLSNTYYLDFHELCVPDDNKLAEIIRQYAFSEKIEIEELSSPMVLFAKKFEDFLIVGAKLRVCMLNELSSRYFYVERCNNTTQTQATVVFCVPIKSFLVLNKEVITNVLRKVYLKSVWFAETINCQKNFIIKIDNYNRKLKAPLFIKNKYKSEYELFYNFNAEVQNRRHKDNFEIIYSLEKYNKYKVIEVLKCNQIKF